MYEHLFFFFFFIIYQNILEKVVFIHKIIIYLINIIFIHLFILIIKKNDFLMKNNQKINYF